MKLKKVVVAAVLLSGFALSGCSSNSYVVTSEAGRVQLSRSVGEKEMRTAIITAAESRDWTVEKEKAGCLTLRLDVRGKHFVVVDVEYGAEWYAVSYVDSGNMDYDPTDGTIRGKYIQWVRNLKKDIRLAALKTR